MRFINFFLGLFGLRIQRDFWKSLKNDRKKTLHRLFDAADVCRQKKMFHIADILWGVCRAIGDLHPYHEEVEMQVEKSEHVVCGLDRYHYYLVSHVFEAVSYTHLTLPTTPYV